MAVKIRNKKAFSIYFFSGVRRIRFHGTTIRKKLLIVLMLVAILTENSIYVCPVCAKYYLHVKI